MLQEVCVSAFHFPFLSIVSRHFVLYLYTMSVPEGDPVIIADPLKSLMKRRSGFKARVTIFTNYLKELHEQINRCKPNKVERTVYLDLEARLENFTRLFSDFDAIQVEIENQHHQDQISYREQFETSYYAALSLAKSLLTECASNSVSAAASSIPAAVDSTVANVKLPKFSYRNLMVITLPGLNLGIPFILSFMRTIKSAIFKSFITCGLP